MRLMASRYRHRHVAWLDFATNSVIAKDFYHAAYMCGTGYYGSLPPTELHALRWLGKPVRDYIELVWVIAGSNRQGVPHLVNGFGRVLAHASIWGMTNAKGIYTEHYDYAYRVSACVGTCWSGDHGDYY